MKFLLFLGTVRDSTPPYPARLGLRVAKAVLACLKQRYPDFDVELIDALDYPPEPVFKPHFSYAKNKAASQLVELAAKIEQADAYLMLSPEYNHSMSPALANLLNHFGSSLFSYKPSAIITYSAGQWGGMRAAINMRVFLSELGCLPVSSMAHVPKAQDVFDEQGIVQAGQDAEAWFDYFARTINQLIWWAHAAQEQRQKLDPSELIGVFDREPSQRNAP
ncbi:MAG: NAD(P)H-dependent oxidoreductase [Pseudohongiellaceae bacterium]|nr:NAD(P)H-dependent oxidoreductase [Pseudohongiellaceae bacterium]